MPRPTILFFASPAAMEEALLAHGADLTIPERLRELQRLNERLFAPLRAALRGRPTEPASSPATPTSPKTTSPAG